MKKIKTILSTLFEPKRCKIHNTLLVAQHGWAMKKSMYCPTCIKELAEAVANIEKQREEDRWRRQARIFREELSKGPEFFQQSTLLH